MILTQAKIAMTTRYFTYAWLSIILSTMIACSNDINEVNKLTSSDLNTKVDVGNDITITYSDSGVIQVICESPVMERHSDQEIKDVFPNGLKITFLDANRQPAAWLEADYAERLPNKYLMTAKGNVRLYNSQNDKLQTSELNWDETRKIIYTEKFVRITRPSQRDTTYGLGFEADQGFKQITIKRRIQSKLNADAINRLSN